MVRISMICFLAKNVTGMQVFCHAEVRNDFAFEVERFSLISSMDVILYGCNTGM
jgi:hypothetical protein